MFTVFLSDLRYAIYLSDQESYLLSNPWPGGLTNNLFRGDTLFEARESMVEVKSDQRSSTDLPWWLSRNFNWKFFIRALNFGQSALLSEVSVLGWWV